MTPIEIKAGQTIATDYFTSLEYWQSLSKQKQLSYLIYAGNKTQQRLQTKILGWRDLNQLFAAI